MSPVFVARLRIDVRDFVASYLCLNDLTGKQDESDSTAVPSGLADFVEDMVLSDWKLQIGAPYGGRNRELHSVDSVFGFDLEDTYASDFVH